MSRVALIFGGPSGEHDVSLASARNIYEAIAKTHLDIDLLGVTKNKVWKLIKPEDLVKTTLDHPIHLEEIGIPVELEKSENEVFIRSLQEHNEKIGPIDAAFPIIHGPYGEDGQLQKELNDLGLSFVGSDFLSCENCMDKVKTKELVSKTSVPQTEYLSFEDHNPEFNEVKEKLGTPFFVKPARMGSSVGISKVRTKTDFLKALADARIHDHKIIIEKNIEGRELECALLETEQGIQVTCLSEIITTHDFYSYEAKYLDAQGSKTVFPADVPEDIATKIKSMAQECFTVLGCRDYGRADFFLTKDGTVYFNEINTHPGFTNISQFPQLWIHEGLAYKDLVMQLIKRAVAR